MKTAKTGVKLLKYMVNVAACVRLLTNTARNGVKLLKLKGKSLVRVGVTQAAILLNDFNELTLTHRQGI
jgi:hypothetical protein|tara:strand:+ start:1154 stop:1360 length:207 start_codon:yes stop_codon:yes gene_type:complete